MAGDNEKLFQLLEQALAGYEKTLTELRQVHQSYQRDINKLQLALKDQENICAGTDLKIGTIEQDIGKIKCRLDKIDAWQKVKLPLIVGTITLLITGLGFFVTMNQIADKISAHKHPTVQVEPTKR